MKNEAFLFGGVAAFFFVTAGIYAGWSREPAGTAALIVAFVMASVISFFFTMNYRRRGSRPEDNSASEIVERSGPLDFFPARSAYPPFTAVGAAVTALGIVFGIWLFLIGFGILFTGVGGMVFQYVHRGE
ncbi:aa3-type cytochrome oxidase subunit IV [Actinacidiphila acidipaludis]|uniref:cytochrome-c oxidase n=1 Tax=Actinacidiphila acidipaludis TaxID=2873382 RepID=A0ABS7QGC2_9ACTN|nr:cytochrome c oxidase subunit 4 [Streptomyces acidipaludis]MBY8882219.1 cytochrome c oxidase subunit 4 [Streptomyces acidipaludis]